MGVMKSGLSLWKHGFLAICLAVMALLIIDFNSRMGEWRRLSLQKEGVAIQATGMVETQSLLETRIAYATSPAGVMEWAYQDGHWVREGDHLVAPIEAPGGVPESTPTPVVIPRVISNWQLWLSLFFDNLFP
jgi:hypothetical protein